jgi:hypothetical protein
MRPGYALYIHRFAYLIVGRTSALVAAMFFAVVLATQAQESVEEAALPPYPKPTLPQVNRRRQRKQRHCSPGRCRTIELILRLRTLRPSRRFRHQSCRLQGITLLRKQPLFRRRGDSPHGGALRKFCRRPLTQVGVLSHNWSDSEGVDDNIFISHTNKSDYYFAIEHITVGSATSGQRSYRN